MVWRLNGLGTGYLTSARQAASYQHYAKFTKAWPKRASFRETGISYGRNGWMMGCLLGSSQIPPNLEGYLGAQWNECCLA